MNTYMNYFQNIAQKYLWEPAVQVNTSSEAIAQYITTFGFAIIYYLGIANIFVGFSLLYNVHKSLIHSFPTYVQEVRATASTWLPFLAPHIPDQKYDGGIPNVASNPCNLDSTEEEHPVEKANVVEDWGGEDSSENSSSDEGVRPPANSTDSGIDLLLRIAEKLEEKNEDTVDGHPHAD
jgi:hypothetical protein